MPETGSRRSKRAAVSTSTNAALGRMQGKGAAAMAEFHKHVKRPGSSGGGVKFHGIGCRAGYKGAVCTCKANAPSGSKGGNKGGDKGGNKGGDRDGKASKGKKGQPAREPWRSDDHPASSAAMRQPDASGT